MGLPKTSGHPHAVWPYPPHAGLALAGTLGKDARATSEEFPSPQTHLEVPQLNSSLSRNVPLVDALRTFVLVPTSAISETIEHIRFPGRLAQRL